MKKISKNYTKLIDSVGKTVESNIWNIEEIAEKVNEIVEYINKKEK